MNIIELLRNKKNNSTLIKEKHSLLKKNNALGLIILNDKKILRELIIGCKNLPIDFIISSDTFNKTEGTNISFSNLYKNKINSGFDFIVGDNELSSVDLYLKNGIVPIVPQKNYIKTILKEFNPIKNEGNSYFYDNNNSWSIYYSIVRYLENYKFTFDNRNLVKNVFHT